MIVKHFKNKSHNDVSQTNSVVNNPIIEASNNIKAGSCNVKFPNKKNR